MPRQLCFQKAQSDGRIWGPLSMLGGTLAHNTSSLPQRLGYLLVKERGMISQLCTCTAWGSLPHFLRRQESPSSSSHCLHLLHSPEWRYIRPGQPGSWRQWNGQRGHSEWSRHTPGSCRWGSEHLKKKDSAALRPRRHRKPKGHQPVHRALLNRESRILFRNIMGFFVHET